MDGLDTFCEHLQANRDSLVGLLTEGLKKVLRDDDIAEDAFAAVNTPLVNGATNRTNLDRNRRTRGRWKQRYTTTQRSIIRE
jgi:hypothetical protein